MVFPPITGGVYDPLGPGLIYAQEDSFIPGGEDYYLFQAPYLLGTGATVTGGQSIQGDILNPAFSGDVQRTTLDLNFAGILDQWIPRWPRSKPGDDLTSALRRVDRILELLCLPPLTPTTTAQSSVPI
jgi:hypothetical protein